MENIHECAAMKVGEAWISNESGKYELNINRVATDNDLEENHHLEAVGETIETVVVNVIFCPYCGERMQKSEDQFVPSFRYHDFSKWS